MREPDLKGEHARAWRYDTTPRAGDPPDWQGWVTTWALTGQFHPFWSWWLVSAVHLRPIPGVRPAHLQFPEATHEIIIVSCEDAVLDVDDPRKRPRVLEPADLVHQVGGVTDDQVREIVRGMVLACVEGAMSPDSDYRRVWKQTIDMTVQHMVLGGHAKGSA